MLGATARSWDEGARPSLAMPNVPEDKYRRHFLSSPDNQRRAWTPFDELHNADEAPKPFQTHHEGRPSNFPPSLSSHHEPKPPEARAGSLGEMSEGGGPLHPARADVYGWLGDRAGVSRRPPTAGVSADYELLEASAGSLGGGKGRASSSLPLVRVQGALPRSYLLLKLIFADPKPPDACACSLDEGYGDVGQLPSSQGPLFSPHNEDTSTSEHFAAKQYLTPTYTPSRSSRRSFFGKRDPSPSSPPTLSHSTPTSQISTPPKDAAQCDLRDAAEG
ncbi:hypothetical protein GGF50DRAFT_121487 [Schizophyllum commune]